MSCSHEDYIKYKIERELEHLLWLQKNIPAASKHLRRSKQLIKKFEVELAKLEGENYD